MDHIPGCAAHATPYSMSNKIIRSGTKTHILYLKYAGGSHIVVIRTWDHIAEEWSDEYINDPVYDNHCGGVLAIDSSGYLHVIYGSHGISGTLWHIKSTNVNDASAWDAKDTVSDGDCSYPSLAIDSNDKLHLIYRGTGMTKLHYESSVNGGTTWSGATELADGSTTYATSYDCSIIVDGSDYLHVGVHFYNMSLSKGKRVGYMRSPDGGSTWEESDGTDYSLPATYASIEVVEDGTNLRIGSIAVDDNNLPMFVTVERDDDPQGATFWRYNGSSWDSTGLAVSSKDIEMYPVTGFYDGIIYVFATINDQGGSWGHASGEVYIFYSDNDGSSFSQKQISTASAPNWNPSIERINGANTMSEMRLLWTNANEEGASNLYFARIDGSYDAVLYSFPDIIPSGSGYVQTFVSWRSVLDSTWEDKDLGDWGLPANAVCEIVLVNTDDGNPATCGVRENGSSLSRYVTLHEAEPTGVDAARMHVQADGDGIIEQYGHSTRSSFILVGYWTVGVYEELANVVQPDRDDSVWHEVVMTGVPVNKVAELVLRNGNTGVQSYMRAREIGAGSCWIGALHEAEPSGGDFVTRMCEVNFESKVDCYSNNSATDIFVAGYWSTTPGTWTGLDDGGTYRFTLPTHDVWADLDLSGVNIPANAVVEAIIYHNDATDDKVCGLRKKGSSDARYLNLHEAEEGDYEQVSFHTEADGSQKIQYYMETCAGTHFIYVLGYWEVDLTYSVSGVTKDAAGDPLGSCTVRLFKTADDSYEDSTVSHATTGAYSFAGLTDNDSRYVIAYKTGTPVFGTTDDLTPEME